MKKILITGSEGYLGSFLTKFFKKNNFQVYGFDIHNEPLSDSYIYHRIDISVKRPRYTIVYNSIISFIVQLIYLKKIKKD